MVAAYHLIWTLYGCWLPNDPRGSSSHTIRTDILKQLGELHLGRKKVQPAAKDLRAFFKKAEELLAHPKLEFSQEETEILGSILSEIFAKERYTCYACALMPDHVHLVIRKHRDTAEIMIEKIQEQSRAKLVEQGIRNSIHPVWGGPGWKVLLDSREDIRRTNRYVEKNPLEIGWSAQQWVFVQEYDGWLPGLGRQRS